MQQSFFKNIRSKIIPYIDNASEEVVVAMAWFTSSELFQAILNCRKRGVHVELILLESEINFMYYAPDFNLLIEAGGIIRIARVENGFMHHKFCVIDNKYVITGSYNWTYYAENRNLENIVISDDSTLVSSYRNQFSELSCFVTKVHECPRLDWEELESLQSIDYVNINYEIDTISKERQLPKRTVFKPTTTVTVETRPLKPISTYNIGIGVDSGGIEVLIPMGSSLPFVSKKLHLFSYSDERDGMSCIVVCESLNGDQFSIARRDITEITDGNKDFELNIELQFNLMPNGDLLAEIRCIETSKVLSVKTNNPDLVAYDE